MDRSIAYQRGVLTKSCNELQDAINKNEIPLIKLNFETLKSKHARLEELNSQNSDEIDKLPDDDYVKAMDKIESYRDKFDKISGEVNTLLSSLKSASHTPTQISSSKLPKIQLPPFSGSVLEFNDIFETFKTSIDSTSLSKFEKFIIEE